MQRWSLIVLIACGTPAVVVEQPEESEESTPAIESPPPQMGGPLSIWVAGDVLLSEAIRDYANSADDPADGMARILERQYTFCDRFFGDDPSDADTFLRDPSQREMFEASFAEGMAQGGEGIYEMIMALWHWGFEPEEIHQHVENVVGVAVK